MRQRVILCVDDEVFILDSLKEQLKRHLGQDYLIEVAESGQEALEIIDDLTEQGVEVPIIISDQIMPGMKGDELLARIHNRHPESLKIFLTGRADADAVGKAVNQADLYRYIPKPWDEIDLNMTVSEGLRSYFQEKKLVEQRHSLKLLYAQAQQELSERRAMEFELRKHQDHLEELVLERTTALEIVNDELSRRVDELTTLNLIAQTITGVTDLHLALEIVAGTMTRLFDSYGTGIFLFSESQTKLTLQAAFIRDETIFQETGLVWNVAEHPWVQDILKEGQPIVISNVKNHPSLASVRAILKRRGIQCMMNVPLHAHGEIIGLVNISSDKANRVFNRVEMELVETIAGQMASAIRNTRLIEEIRRARQVAETASQAKSQFLANMSHELRTPLNGILGYAQILSRDSAATPYQQDRLKIIQQSGEHLLLLINDILDIARIEAGRVELSVTEFHFPQFLERLIEMMRLRAEDKNIRFVWHPFDFEHNRLAETLPELVYGDEKRLRQVLINLLGNAVKFTDKGEVLFKIGRVAGDTPATQWIRFHIQDTGIGISPQQLDAIFEPFHQAGDAQRNTEGTGLGLPISQNLIRLMGGELYVESTPGQGSLFWFDLLLPEVTGPTGPGTAHDLQIVGFKGGPIKLLVVDDDLDSRQVLVDLLSPLGFEIIEATDGEEGLQKVAHTGIRAIIVDLLMPNMDGFEFIRQIQQSPAAKECVLIATSANVSAEIHQKSLDVGGGAFLPKPIKAADLFDFLSHHLAIDWIHQPASFPPPSSGTDSDVSMMLPATDRLEHLYKLTLIGDIKAIQNYATDVALTDEKLRPFAAKVRELASSFQTDAISRWIKPHLE